MSHHSIHNLGFDLGSDFQDVTTLMLRADVPVRRTLTVNREPKQGRTLQTYGNAFRTEYISAKMPGLRVGQFVPRTVGPHAAIAAKYTHDLPPGSTRQERVDRHFIVIDDGVYFYAITYTCPADYDARDLESMLASCSWAAQ